MAMVVYDPAIAQEAAQQTMYLPLEFHFGQGSIPACIPFGMIDGVVFDTRDKMVWRRGRADQILGCLYGRMLVKEAFAAFAAKRRAAVRLHSYQLQRRVFKAFELHWAATALCPDGARYREVRRDFERLCMDPQMAIHCAKSPGFLSRDLRAES